MTSRNWAVILAGGNGHRLQSLTKLVTGDDRPKQFCPMFAGRTLLDETRARVAKNVPFEQTLIVVTRTHGRYYRQALAGLPTPLLIEQPVERGTTAAIAYGVARVQRADEDGVIGFFPADHYYADPEPVRASIEATFNSARLHPDRLFIVGAEADRAETEYGWIQPGAPLDCGSDVDIRAVECFWEKPSAERAMALLARQCLWNTFVTIGSVRAFDAILAQAVPEIWTRMLPLRQPLIAEDEDRLVARMYETLSPSDFSREVLATHAPRLAVVRLPPAGWTDLGDPARALDVLAARGFRLAVRGKKLNNGVGAA